MGSARRPEIGAALERLVTQLQPAQCDSAKEYRFAKEFHGVPCGIDLWSLVFLTPDGEVVWAGWEPLEIHRSREEDHVRAALRMAAERFPELAGFFREPL
jgi:hypothetical protein